MKFLGLVTARAGSKGLPGKNIALAGGEPLVVWTIRAALSARHLRGNVLVSTDSKEIADVCTAHGAQVPFLRPAELARDDTSHVDVLLHALNWLELYGSVPEYVVLLQPTSPLRIAGDIDGAIDLTIARNADSVISVFPAPVHPYWIRKLDGEGRLSDFMNCPTESDYKRRQTFPAAYAMNGAVYVIRSKILRDRRGYVTERTYGYVMPAERSLDVDTSWHLRLADALLRQQMGGPS